MAYCLRNDESIPKGLRRLLKKELRSAVEQLVESENADDAIHEARKSIKKVRAAVRLIRKGVPDVTDRDRELLRRSGRLLSQQRDTDAMLQTARDLCGRYPSVLKDEMCAALRRHLATKKGRAHQAAKLGRTRTQAVEALQAVRRSAKRWDLKEARFSVLARGLKRAYRDARKAMPGAPERNNGAALHRWRRRVKVLWYNLRLFEERMPLVKRLADDLERLETWLGEDHNLVLLRNQISAGRMLQQDRSVLTRLTVLSKRRQKELRRASLSLGARVFARKPKDFFRYLQLWRQAADVIAPSRKFKAVRSAAERPVSSRTAAPRRLAAVIPISRR